MTPDMATTATARGGGIDRPLFLFVGALVLLVVASSIMAAALVSVTRGPTRQELERLSAVDPGIELRAWTHIVLHHSGTAANDAASMGKYHRETLGWQNGLGYDFVVGNGTRSGDGQIEVSTRWRRQIDGAHCKASGMNRRAIGICFVGNFEIEHGLSDAQILAGTALIRYLTERFSIPPENILGHGEVPGANTLCPGRFFPMDRMRAAARARSQQN